MCTEKIESRRSRLKQVGNKIVELAAIPMRAFKSKVGKVFREVTAESALGDIYNLHLVDDCTVRNLLT